MEEEIRFMDTTKRVTTKFRKLFKINRKKRESIYLPLRREDEEERVEGSPLWAHDMIPG